MIKYLLTIVIALLSLSSFSQEIPVGSCGLLLTYDAAGNRIKREYYCNNGSSRIAPQELAKEIEAAATGFEEVEALYPNPTTGRFFTTFSKPIDQSVIQILDVNGKLIQQVKGSGNRLEFDLSHQPSGTYFVLINTNGVIINKKVIRTK